MKAFVCYALLQSCFVLSSGLTNEIVKSWSSSFTQEVEDVVTSVMKAPTLQKQMDDAPYSDVPLNGVSEAAQAASEVFLMLTGYVKYVHTLAEVVSDAFNSKHNASAVHSCVRSDFGAAPADWTASAKFGHLPVDFSGSTCRTAVSGAPLNHFLAANTAELDVVFRRNDEASPEIRHQYMALEDDMLLSYPGQMWAQQGGATGSFSDYLPQIQPWYVAAVADFKNLVVVADFSVPEVLFKLFTLLDTLSPQDFVAVVAFDAESIIAEVTDATSQLPLRAHPENVAELKQRLQLVADIGISDPNRRMGLTRAIDRGYNLSAEATSEITHGTACASTLLLITSLDDPLPPANDVLDKLPPNQRTIIFGVTSEGFSRRLHEFSCGIDALYRHVDSSEDNTYIARSYYRYIPAAPNPAQFPYAMLWGTNGTSGGLRPDLFIGRSEVFLTVSMPVYSHAGTVPRLVGVVAADFGLDALKTRLDSFKKGRSFMMLLSPFGDTLYHKIQSKYKVAYPVGTGQDISLYESFAEFDRTVRNPLLTEVYGQKEIVVDRAFEQGDAQYEGVETQRLATSYIWQRVPDFSFVLAYVRAQEDSFVRTHYFQWDEANTLCFARPDLYLAPVNEGLFPGEIINDDNCYTYDANGSRVEGAFLEGCTQHPNAWPVGAISLDTGCTMFPPRCWNEHSAFLDPATWREDPEWVHDLHLYMNRQPGSSNSYPWLSEVCQENLVMQTMVYSLLKHDAVAADTVWNYFASHTGASVIFPAGDWGMWWDPARRPWYSRAVANQGKRAISTPYIDGGGAGLMNSLSTVIHRSNKLESGGAQSTFVEGVSSYDYVYPTFHKLLHQVTQDLAGGCSSLPVQEHTAQDVAMCFLFDTAGLLLRHSDFLLTSQEGAEMAGRPGDSDMAWPISNVFLGKKEPSLASALLDAGFLVLRRDVLTIDSSMLLSFYTTNATVLRDAPGGVLSGTLSDGCTAGEWHVVELEGTNAFLLAVDGYERLAACDPVEAPPPRPAPSSQAGREGGGSKLWACSQYSLESSFVEDSEELEQRRVEFGHPDFAIYSCQACGLGRRNHKGQCEECAPGSFSNTTRSFACMPCAPGSYQSIAAARECNKCPPGHHMPHSGHNGTECHPCPEGFEQPASASEQCSACPKGYHADDRGTPVCERCEPGKYSDQVGQAECSACPANTKNYVFGINALNGTLAQLADISASSVDFCLPIPGYYGSPGSAAQVCPEGGACCTCPNKTFATLDEGLRKLKHVDGFNYVDFCDCLAGSMPLPFPLHGYVRSEEAG
ncbi:hypothetical protein CYMTET_54645 [Cymbomonas tetramitiformis]|uniref:Tyrosine-protein kinase ephrin type A/B receptor-like domain-containing protein n=1 Tax=Cymbomonas tetramitiformis TaxID=36881 RepID=A0AAE0BER3_9CHLO|nr:hypothetical protein CYMTET_54645 [Cymbomonas tetramitiformis]